MNLQNPDPGWRRDVLWLALALGIFFCIGLGARPYLAPSEARYIEIPRQMIVSGDWITPHINGVKYFEKPPLFYWMQAAWMSLFGLGEFSGRFLTMLCMLGTALATYATGRMLHGRQAGLIAAGVFSTSLLGYAMSRMAVLDVPVSLFLTLTMGCFLAARFPHPTLPRKRGRVREGAWYYGMYACAALALLTKGLIGIVLPGLIVGLWILCTRQWRVLREARIPTGTLLFLAIAAPWHFLVGQKNPEFWHFYFIREHVERFLTNEHHRTAPWWFFIAVTLAGMLPWAVFLPAALKQAWRRARSADPVTVFLLLWTFVPLVFFSLSHSKLTSYILPVFPPLAILTARGMMQLSPRTVRGCMAGLAALLATISLAYLFIPMLPVKKMLLAEDIRQQVKPLILLMAFSAFAFLAACLARWEKSRLLVMAGIYAVLFDITLNTVAVQADTTSVKPFAHYLNLHIKTGDEVIVYQTYYQDIPVYLNRNVTVAGWEGELKFGIDHDPSARQWMVGEKDFLARCPTTQHIFYVLMPQRYYEGFRAQGCTLRVAYSNERNILLTNQP